MTPSSRHKQLIRIDVLGYNALLASFFSVVALFCCGKSINVCAIAIFLTFFLVSLMLLSRHMIKKMTRLWQDCRAPLGSSSWFALIWSLREISIVRHIFSSEMYDEMYKWYETNIGMLHENTHENISDKMRKLSSTCLTVIRLIAIGTINYVVVLSFMLSSATSNAHLLMLALACYGIANAMIVFAFFKWMSIWMAAYYDALNCRCRYVKIAAYTIIPIFPLGSIYGIWMLNTVLRKTSREQRSSMMKEFRLENVVHEK